jgi:hypothetical protein
MNRLDDSCMTLDVRAANRFCYAAENDDGRFAVRDRFIHVCCLHFGFHEQVSLSINLW